MLIMDATSRGSFHISSLDDITIFSRGTIGKLRSIKEIMDIYCKATKYEVNMMKSSIMFNEVEEEVKTLCSLSLTLILSVE